MGMLERCQRGGTVEDMPLNLVLGDWQVAIPHLPCRKAAGEQARKGLQSIQDVVPPPTLPWLLPSLAHTKVEHDHDGGGTEESQDQRKDFLLLPALQQETSGGIPH
jgi:hypothetical protein